MLGKFCFLIFFVKVIAEEPNDLQNMTSTTIKPTTIFNATSVKTNITSTVPLTTNNPTTSFPVTTTMSDLNEITVKVHGPPSKLIQRLESLSCDIPTLPSESRLWKPNQTHELFLPTIMEGRACEDDESSCSTAASISWEATAEIQSGDVLLVRIDASTLHLHTTSTTQTSISIPSLPIVSQTYKGPQVYQVRSSGFDHCDVSSGQLLDISPLIVDGKHVLALYDKDLDDGANSIIVTDVNWNTCAKLRVLVKSDNCGEGQDCSGKGICFSNISMDIFECQCCPGFEGIHCEERDACFESPCLNKGICVDLSQGHEGVSFQCLCPYGFEGKTCETKTDACASDPCQGGGTCVHDETSARFKCECPTGLAGPLCQHKADQCKSSPCRNGICVVDESSIGFKCFCKPGFTGEHCEIEYNECESSPCLHSGTCVDRVGSYTCVCGRGFTGKNCQTKVDLCDPNPCHQHHLCMDQGNSYTCECPKGYSGPDCLIPSTPICVHNPCLHGGTCWSSVDTFYCACRPGYTGQTCEQPFYLEAIPTPELATLSPEPAPLPLPLDHLHNAYIAAGTLACAVLIVALTVASCHCRMHQTYKRCFVPGKVLLLPCKGSTLNEDSPQIGFKTRNSDLLGINSPGTSSGNYNKLESTSVFVPALNQQQQQQQQQHSQQKSPFSTLEPTEMYYTLDFSDNQNSPLIQ